MRHLRTALVAWAAAAVALPALAENCIDTGFVTLAAADCRGAFVGSLTGNPAENVALATAWGGNWVFAGKSNDTGNGPFSSNPQLAFSGALVFDTPISGDFVIGLVGANLHPLSHVVQSMRKTRQTRQFGSGRNRARLCCGGQIVL